MKRLLYLAACTVIVFLLVFSWAEWLVSLAGRTGDGRQYEIGPFSFRLVLTALVLAFLLRRRGSPRC
jgi:hypothetical protein